MLIKTSEKTTAVRLFLESYTLAEANMVDGFMRLAKAGTMAEITMA